MRAVVRLSTLLLVLWATGPFACAHAGALPPAHRRPAWLNDTCAHIEDAYYFVGAGRGDDISAMALGALLDAKKTAAACLLDTTIRFRADGEAAGSYESSIRLDNLSWAGFVRVPDRQWIFENTMFVQFKWPAAAAEESRRAARGVVQSLEAQARERAGVETQAKLLQDKQADLARLDQIIEERRQLIAGAQVRAATLDAQSLELNKLRQNIDRALSTADRKVSEFSSRNALLRRVLQKFPCGFPMAGIEEVLGAPDRKSSCELEYGDLRVFGCTGQVDHIVDLRGHTLVGCKQY